MKVLLVHNSYRDRGGEEIVYEQERDLLRSHGVEVLEYRRDNELPTHLSFCDRLKLAGKTVWSDSTWVDVRRLLRSERPDIVHVHNTLFRISPSVYWACQAVGVPVVQTLHNYRLLCPGAQLMRSSHVCEECIAGSVWHGVRHGCYRDSRLATGVVALMVSVHRWRKTWTDCVDGYIALSEFSRTKFVEGGLPPSKIFVKPNFVQPDPGLGDGQQYAVFLGRLSVEKGVHRLLSAWKLLYHRIPLLIVGDGPLRNELQQQVINNGLSMITFCGQVERTRAMSIVKKARFLLLPSECYENFPCAIAEAYACGVPVLASSLGSIKELVEDHRTGLQFRAGDTDDLAQTVDWAWSHPQELRIMGRAARAEYEARFSAERNYTLLMNIYHRVIADHRGAHARSCMGGLMLPCA